MPNMGESTSLYRPELQMLGGADLLLGHGNNQRAWWVLPRKAFPPVKIYRWIE
jgi:hypothetical protein